MTLSVPSGPAFAGPATSGPGFSGPGSVSSTDAPKDSDGSATDAGAGTDPAGFMAALAALLAVGLPLTPPVSGAPAASAGEAAKAGTATGAAGASAAAPDLISLLRQGFDRADPLSAAGAGTPTGKDAPAVPGPDAAAAAPTAAAQTAAAAQPASASAAKAAPRGPAAPGGNRSAAAFAELIKDIDIDVTVSAATAPPPAPPADQLSGRLLLRQGVPAATGPADQVTPNPPAQPATAQSAAAQSAGVQTSLNQPAVNQAPAVQPPDSQRAPAAQGAAATPASGDGAVATAAATATAKAPQSAPSTDAPPPTDRAASAAVPVAAAAGSAGQRSDTGAGDGRGDPSGRSAAPAQLPATATTPDAVAFGQTMSVARADAPTSATPVQGSAPTPFPTTAGQLAARIVPLASQPDGVQKMTLHLHPDDLGPVQIVMELRDGSLKLQMNGTNPAGADALRNSINDLRRDLQAAGLNTTSIDVGAGGSDARQTAPGQTPGGWGEPRQPRAFTPRGAGSALPTDLREASTSTHRPTTAADAGVDVRI